MKLLNVVVFVLLLIGCLVWQCSQHIAGGEVANERTCVVLPDGNTPAVGAVVQIIPVTFVPGEGNSMLYTKITDDSGSYSFEDIPAGVYNVFTKKDSLVAYDDSVFVGRQSFQEKDTLEFSGAIMLRARLQPNHNLRSVVVQVLGSTMYFTNVDSSGVFVLSGLASGVYRLRLSTDITGYTPTFCSVVVQPDPDTLLDATNSPIELIYTGIPVVSELAGSFDQLHSVITLTWKPSLYGDLLDYVVYRDSPDDRTVSQEWTANVQENRFADSIGDLRLSDSMRTVHFRYRVAVRNQSLNIGETFGFVVVDAELTPSNVTLFPDTIISFFPGTPVRLLIKPVPEVSEDDIRYFWSIGDATEFVEVSGPETSIVITIPKDSIVPSLECRARIVNEAGVAFNDTLYLQSRMAWEKLADLPGAAGLPIHVVAKNDSLFMFCVGLPGGTSSHSTMWSSADGIGWRQVGSPVPFSGDYWKPVVFNGKFRVLIRDKTTPNTVLWSSADGSIWDSTRLSGMSIAGYQPDFDVLAVHQGNMVLVNYYPPCLSRDGCSTDATPYVWTSADAESWQRTILPGALFPDRFDEPNRHFTAIEANGSLVIAGAWRTAYLTNPPNASYQLRIWNNLEVKPREIALPVLGQEGVFSEYYPAIAEYRGTLFAELLNDNYSDPHFELWALHKNGTWQRCSDRCPAQQSKEKTSVDHALVAAYGSILSVSPAGIWRIKR